MILYFCLISLLKGTNGILYSEATEENIRDKNVLIINNIGLLSNIYQYGKLAYIGGGFGNGIHNTLEPVSFGIPVISYDANCKGSLSYLNLAK